MNGIKPAGIAKTDIVSSTRMKGTVHVQGGVGAEHHAVRVGEKEVGAGDGAAESPVNHGRGAPGDASNDVLYRIGARESAAFTGIDVEGLEAVKEVASCLGAHLVGDDVVGTGYGAFGTDGSIQDYFRMGR